VSLLAAFLLTLAVVDLVRWSPEATARGRTALALVCGAATALGLALLVGQGGSAAGLAGLTAAGLVPALAWVAAGSPRLRAGGATPLAVLTVLGAGVLLALPAAPPVAGALGRWYAGLDLPGLRGVPAGQALGAVAAGLFGLSTANRVVRLVLSVAGTPPVSGEATLRGGRLLGPLERTFILALALAGDLTAAAVVIAAKGVLRLPEIRSAREERRGGADVVTEYFLVGTFTSWLLAVGLAGLVRLAG
jgi:hypothetical protein